MSVGVTTDQKQTLSFNLILIMCILKYETTL